MALIPLSPRTTAALAWTAWGLIGSEIFILEVMDTRQLTTLVAAAAAVSVIAAIRYHSARIEHVTSQHADRIEASTIRHTEDLKTALRDHTEAFKSALKDHAEDLKTALKDHAQLLTKHILSVERYFTMGGRSVEVAKIQAASEVEQMNGTGPFPAYNAGNGKPN